MSRHCPSVDCHASVPTCLVYILKRCTIPTSLPGAELEECSLCWEQSWLSWVELTLSQVLWHLLDVSPALLSGAVIPHGVASIQDWLDRFGIGVPEG